MMGSTAVNKSESRRQDSNTDTNPEEGAHREESEEEVDSNTEDNEVPGAPAVGRIRGGTTEGCLEPALHRYLWPEKEEEWKKETLEPDWERGQED
ncbi:hypothetical protein NDU88_002259 [Pleurodeles waltl]|uniref:Uncharacterized protein n=1 Tax=Pleurodeles waltl TaxID=8319 RepID=A0AAV7Q9C4_PLEWA|nr:hypothetical protein NDU88_002259 [Pleurodeles waltl]